MIELAADSYEYIARRLREIRGERPPAPEASPTPAKATVSDDTDDAWEALIAGGYPF